MICYRDMTFCSEKECKKWDECLEAYTDDERKKAERWWGTDSPPICFYLEKPDCFEEKIIT